MKRLIFFFLLVSTSLMAEAQTNSYKTIARKNKAEITEVKVMNEGEPDGIFYLLSAQNSEYKTIIDIFSITSGDAQFMYDFLHSLKEFNEKNKDQNNVVQTIEGVRVQILRVPIFGTSIIVYGDYKNHDFKPADINALLNKFKKYCEKNSIDLE